MLIVGLALFTAGGLTLWLLPALSLWWVVVAVITVSHIGLLMAMGAAVLRWITSRRRPIMPESGPTTKD
jgi:hypothetical protein